MPDRTWLGRLLAASFMLMASGGCTSAQAAIYGKLMFGVMVAFLVATPIVFYREWRRRRGR